MIKITIDVSEILYQFSRRKAKNAQHVNFINHVIEVTTAEVAERCGFLKYQQKFAEAVKEELAHFKKERSYVLTGDIKEQDGIRIDDFLCFKGITKSYALYSNEADKKSAGKIAYQPFKEIRTLTKEDYESTTAYLTDLVETLRSEEIADALETIGIPNAADVIEASNKKFDEIYSIRSNEQYIRANAKDMLELRRTTDHAFNDMCGMINSIIKVNPEFMQDDDLKTELEDIIYEINKLIVRLKKVIGYPINAPASSDDENSPEPAITEVIAADGNKEGNLVRDTEVTLKGNQIKVVDITGDDLGDLILINSNDEENKVKNVRINTPEKVVFTVPGDLAEGAYTLRIETYYDDKGLLDDPRVLQCPIPLTIS